MVKAIEFLKHAEIIEAISPIMETLKPALTAQENAAQAPLNRQSKTGYPMVEILDDLNKIENKIHNSKFNDAGKAVLSGREKRVASRMLNDINFPESMRLEQMQHMKDMAKIVLENPEHRQKILECVHGKSRLTSKEAYAIAEDMVTHYQHNHLEQKVQLESNFSLGSYFENKGIDEETSRLSLSKIQVHASKPKHLGIPLGVIAHEITHGYQMKFANRYQVMDEAEKTKIETFIKNDYEGLAAQDPENALVKKAEEYISAKIAAVSVQSYGGFMGWRRQPLELNSQIAAEYFTDEIIAQLDLEPELAKKIDQKSGYEYKARFNSDLKRIAEQIDYSVSNPGSLEGLPVKAKDSQRIR